MSRRKHKLLVDVWLAVEQINAFIADTPTFAAFAADPRTRSAVNWQLAIVGEATNKLRQEDPPLERPSARQIIGLRNRLVHAYDGIDDASIWDIVCLHLPPLRAEVRRQIAALERGESGGANWAGLRAAATRKPTNATAL